jgi:hypothetical protein
LVIKQAHHGPLAGLIQKAVLVVITPGSHHLYRVSSGPMDQHASVQCCTCEKVEGADAKVLVHLLARLHHKQKHRQTGENWQLD